MPVPSSFQVVRDANNDRRTPSSRNEVQQDLNEEEEEEEDNDEDYEEEEEEKEEEETRAMEEW